MNETLSCMKMQVRNMRVQMAGTENASTENVSTVYRAYVKADGFTCHCLWNLLRSVGIGGIDAYDPASFLYLFMR